MVKQTNVRMGLRWPGLLLLLLSLTALSCGPRTSDPTVTLGDVYVPRVNCEGTKTALDYVVVSITVPVTVSATLPSSQVCWVGVFEDLVYGDEVGNLITCGYQTFQESGNIGFSFGLSDGYYAVIIGITKDIGDECYVFAASEKQGPKRMSVGGPDCNDPPPIPIAKIEYDCMSGYDIRGPADTLDNDNIYKYARKRFDQGMMQLAFVEHSLDLPAQIFSSANAAGGLADYLILHWSRRFLYDSTNADFCLIGIRNCVDRDTFYGVGRPPLPDSAVGLSGALLGNPDSLFGKQTGAWCLIFKEHLDSVLNQNGRQKGYNRNAVHELGHALAGLTHPEERPDLHNGGADANCVMGMMGVVLPIPGDIEYGKDKFCRKCEDLVKAADWVSGKTK
jgi:hypothetical protein